jgi:hypothetical protein
MLEISKYVRKPFHIDAVQVTAENIADIAAWAEGDVRSDSENAKYVKVRVHRPLNDRQTKAYIGDWVLYAGTGFKVYTPKAFANSFEPASTQLTFQDADNTIDIAKPKPAKREQIQVSA